MGRGFCKKVNYEEVFGNHIKGNIITSGQMCKRVARNLMIGNSTLSSRFNHPGKMSLGELKRFIKAGYVGKDELIFYLYEGKEA